MLTAMVEYINDPSKPDSCRATNKLQDVANCDLPKFANRVSTFSFQL